MEALAEAVRIAIYIAEGEDVLLLTDKGREETLLIGNHAIRYKDKKIGTPVF